MEGVLLKQIIKKEETVEKAEKVEAAENNQKVERAKQNEENNQKLCGGKNPRNRPKQSSREKRK